MNGTPVDLSAFVGVIDNALGVTEEKAEAKGLHLPAQYASGIDANTGQIIISSSQTKEAAISGLVNAESEAETSEGKFGKNWVSRHFKKGYDFADCNFGANDWHSRRNRRSAGPGRWLLHCQRGDFRFGERRQNERAGVQKLYKIFRAA